MTGWKTYLFSFLVTGIGALEALNWTAIIPQGRIWSGLALSAVGVGFAFLRKITKTPAAI